VRVTDLRVAMTINKRFSDALDMLDQSRDELLWEVGTDIQDDAFENVRKVTTSLAQSITKVVGGYKSDEGERRGASVSVNPRVQFNDLGRVPDGTLVVAALATHAMKIEFLEPYLKPAFSRATGSLGERAKQAYRALS
jgi:hypothetical protein